MFLFLVYVCRTSHKEQNCSATKSYVGSSLHFQNRKLNACFYAMLEYTVQIHFVENHSIIIHMTFRRSLVCYCVYIYSIYAFLCALMSVCVCFFGLQI